MRKVLLATALSLVVGSSALADGLRATAEMMNQDGASLGNVELFQFNEMVILKVDLAGIEPGVHGFHIHETGACGDGFKAAGGHFNPDGHGHGYAGGGSHAGDLSNVVAHETGKVIAEVFAKDVTLMAGPKNSLFDADGSAIVIHANADTYGKNAGAGARVACGVIKPAS